MAAPTKNSDEMAVADAHEDSGEMARDKLLKDLKKEVKQIMEEGVTRRFVQEECSYVTSLCAAVEACLAAGLKRRVLGLFGTSSTFALLHKISKLCPPAASVLKMVIAMQQLEVKEKTASSLDRFRSTKTAVKDLPIKARFLWIRVALYEKVLAAIVDFIGRNAHRYYDNEALMMDPVRGGMVAALLVGPCAVEFTKMKSVENYWSDPTADELVQRHRMHSGTVTAATDSPISPRRPALSVVKRGSSLASTSDVDPTSAKLATHGREYVHSLHQNFKSTLLYGKNNVSVSPADHPTPLKGYLSLHQNANGTMSIKWTPNELMHSNSQPSQPPATQPIDRNSLWRYAINLNVDEVIYLHFHQKGETGGSIVLVGTDGVQHPPIQFPAGQHPLSFLSCLENGLLPWGQLDPPLWLQKGKGKVFPKLRRKTSTSNGRSIGHDFQQQQMAVSETASIVSSDDGEGIQPDESHDYVFRIVPVMQARAIASELNRRTKESAAPNSNNSRLVAISGLSSLLKERLMSLSSSPASSPPPTPPTAGSVESDGSAFRPPETESEPASPHVDDADGERRAVEKRNSEPIALPENERPPVADSEGDVVARSNLMLACDSMRNQILSRAFYGWLAHCRHLKTVRNHLSRLMMKEPIEPIDGGVSPSVWERLYANRTPEAEEELVRRTYFGGVSPELRVRVWPYLLGLVQWNEVIEEKAVALKMAYEGMMTDWMAVEAIVRQRDKEAFDAGTSHTSDQSDSTPKVYYASAARVRYDSQGGDMSLTGRDTTLRNDVFGSEDDGSELCVTEPAAPPETDSSASTPLSASQNDACHATTLTADLAVSGHSTPLEGDGGIYTKELIDMYALNLHRIEKDVHRCDRNYPYFTTNENLEKLKNIMCTYVWEHLDHGYVQGMCDLAAPLLVVFDDEVLTYGCFTKVMERMTVNFPHGGGMDEHLANLRALMQVMDSELFDLIHQNGDYTHFYFCYRWFLLDFKRELAYEDVFLVWETIWAAARCATAHFQLFFALGLMLAYRDIILGNNMDFTDIIKFFNEMAERHDALAALRCARDQVRRLQLLMLDSNIR